MDFEKIDILMHIEKTGSLTQTADILGVSQPYLSRLLKECEFEMGTQLFLRLPKKLVPTKEGLLYLETFKDIKRLLSKTKENVHILQNNLIEEISLGVHPIIGEKLVPRIEEQISKNEKLSLIYSFRNSKDIVSDVLAGNLDCGVVADAKKYPELIIKNLWKEYVGLYSQNGKISQDILYNSNMIDHQKILNKIKYVRSKKIDDYSVLYSILKNEKYMGLLPAPIVAAKGDLKLIKKYNDKINISLIYRYDRKRTRSFSFVTSLLSKNEIDF